MSTTLHHQASAAPTTPSLLKGKSAHSCGLCSYVIKLGIYSTQDSYLLSTWPFFTKIVFKKNPTTFVCVQECCTNDSA